MAPPDRPRTLVPDLLNHASRRYPTRTCVIVEDRIASFREVSDRAAAFAGYLGQRGLAGRRVAVLAYNELELIEIRTAVPRAGAVLVPLNYRLSVGELAAAIEDCEPDLLIVGPGLEEVAELLPVADQLVLGETGSYAAAIAGAAPQPVPPALLGDALAMINYTSGTTGTAQGGDAQQRCIARDADRDEPGNGGAPGQRVHVLEPDVPCRRGRRLRIHLPRRSLHPAPPV